MKTKTERAIRSFRFSFMFRFLRALHRTVRR